MRGQDLEGWSLPPQTYFQPHALNVFVYTHPLTESVLRVAMEPKPL